MNKNGEKSNKGKRTKSKFSSKYSDRIASIKEDDEKNKKRTANKKKPNKKTPQEIRNEMLKELDNKNLSDKK